MLAIAGQTAEVIYESRDSGKVLGQILAETSDDKKYIFKNNETSTTPEEEHLPSYIDNMSRIVIG